MEKVRVTHRWRGLVRLELFDVQVLDQIYVTYVQVRRAQAEEGDDGLHTFAGHGGCGEGARARGRASLDRVDVSLPEHKHIVGLYARHEKPV